MIDYKILKMGLEEGKFEMKSASKSAERFRKNPEEILKKEEVKNTAESYAEKARDLYDSSVKALFKAKEKVYGKFDEMAHQKELKEKYLEMRKQGVHNILYYPDAGVVGAVSRDLENSKIENLESRNYYNCSGVILQTLDGAALLHISPNLIDKNVKNNDYPSYIGEAMKYLAMEKSDYEKIYESGKYDESTKILRGKYGKEFLNEFTEEEILKLEKELKITIAAGDPKLGEYIYNTIKTGKGFGDLELSVSDVEPVYYEFDDYGLKGGKDIIVSPKDILMVRHPTIGFFPYPHKNPKEKYYDLSVKE